MRRYFIKVWYFCDPLYYSFTRLKYIGKHNKNPGNIFRVRLTRYKGREVTLKDGTTIRKNDLLLKIHLHNVRILHDIQHIKDDVKKGFMIYQIVKESMPGLATYVQSHKRYDEIKGVIGITMLSKGSRRLGFEKVTIKNLIYKWMKVCTFLPICFLSLTRPSIGKIRKLPEPVYLFMSKADLVNRYSDLKRQSTYIKKADNSL
ncbi:YkoP family protein [Salirhabdus salicampi]|uniref:YkoP family protein n=1 Tax=Salirhabdus salicampi TaxID=476102 RepID=UPI0020C2F51D|nr:hypothetical protein [Salirhabdus salicampi]MCP8615615.1 hypothetical protein [Salirhabdus salicampi]